tara:strand:- start:11 stop:181 length:171 start_codon:yes stop_codon:yes gene_type:complete
MSTQQTGLSNDDSTDDTKGTTARLPARMVLIAIVVLVAIMGSPWWVTAIPQFGFTN